MRTSAGKGMAAARRPMHSALLLALASGTVFLSLAQCATFPFAILHPSSVLTLTWKNGNTTVARGADIDARDFPVRWPVGDGRRRRGIITQGYGPTSDPTTGAKGFHEGIDIAVPSGTPVLAAGTGTVTETGFSRSLGVFVSVAHRSGFTTLYSHMQVNIGVKKGDAVAAGQQIGGVGTTGISTGPHLHFQIELAGRTIDPMEILDGTISAGEGGAFPGRAGLWPF